jgi:hypothetical protein
MEWQQSVHPDYEISEYGDLRTLVERYRVPIGTELRGTVDRNGYRTYSLIQPGEYGRGAKRKLYAAHRLVLFAFIGEPPTKKHQCAHYDGNPQNNHVSNLRWATPAENTADKIRHGNIYAGHRKYEVKQVLDMRAMREAGAKYSEIMDKYNISKGNLSAIIQRKTWDYV